METEFFSGSNMLAKKNFFFVSVSA